jgi:hypothetical protein
MSDPGGRTSGREPGKVLCLVHHSGVDHASTRPLDLQPVWYDCEFWIDWYMVVAR